MRSLPLLPALVALFAFTAPALALDVPDAQRAAFDAARADAEAKRYLDAEKKLADLVKAAPASRDARVLLAAVYTEEYRDDDARKLLDEVLKEQPDHVEALFNLARLEYYRKDLEKAAALFRKVADQDSANPAAHYYLGEIAWAAFKDDVAEKEYKAALAIAPAYSKPWYPLAFLYYKQKKYVPAEEHAKKGLEAEPEDFRCLNLLGLVYYETYKDAEAEKQFRLALKANPGFGFGWFNLGMLFYSQQKYDPARENFQKALTFFDPRAEAGNIEKTNDYLKKIDVLKKGGKVDESSDPIKKPGPATPRKGNEGRR